MGGIVSSIGRFFRSYDQKGLATIPRQSRVLAWFAKEAYNRNPPKEHLGYVRILNHATFKAYINEAKKTIILAVRGTDLKSNTEDIETDIRVALGSETQTERYKIAQEFTLSLMRKYPHYKFLVTGHSLGGGIAYRLADRFQNLTGEVFNPAVNLTTLRDAQGATRRIKALIIHGDPVAGLLGRPLPNAQVYSPGYGAERERIEGMPLKERLLFLHAMARFPRI